MVARVAAVSCVWNSWARCSSQISTRLRSLTPPPFPLSRGCVAGEGPPVLLADRSSGRQAALREVGDLGVVGAGAGVEEGSMSVAVHREQAPAGQLLGHCHRVGEWGGGI